MTENEWNVFFTLLNQIVNLEGLSASEKADLVVAEAKHRGESAEMDLEEFTAWDFLGY